MKSPMPASVASGGGGATKKRSEGTQKKSIVVLQEAPGLCSASHLNWTMHEHLHTYVHVVRPACLFGNSSNLQPRVKALDSSHTGPLTGCCVVEYVQYL